MAVVDRMTSFVTTSSDWEQMTDGQTFILIQAISTGVVHIHAQAAGDAAPSANDAHVTIARNQNDMESSFSAGGLPDGTKVWIKSAKEGETELVTVLTY
jgi:hypothetical protein